MELNGSDGEINQFWIELTARMLCMCVFVYSSRVKKIAGKKEFKSRIESKFSEFLKKKIHRKMFVK